MSNKEQQEESRFTRREVIVSAAVTVGGLLIGCGSDSPPLHREDLSYLGPDFPSQNKIDPLLVDKFHQPEPVRKAVLSMVSHQPEGTYILTDLHNRRVVPMDVAHAAIALSKVKVSGIDCLGRAEAGINWVLERMETGETPVTEIINGKERKVSYAGTFWDAYGADGKRTPKAGRGRGEGVGLILMAIDSIYQQDPTYLNRSINGKSVHEYVSMMVDSLQQLQRVDGTFTHKPIYDTAFVEENVRMTLGLRYAAEMLENAGNDQKSDKARDMARRGDAAIKRGANLECGMSYDFMGEAMWGEGGVIVAQKAMDSLRVLKISGAPLLNDSGVRVYDWQQEDILKQIRYYYQQFPNGSAETAEAGITALMAGELDTALKMENSLLKIQGKDGGFPSTFVTIKVANLPIEPIHIGQSVVYAAARFVLLDRMITEAKSRLPTPLFL